MAWERGSLARVLGLGARVARGMLLERQHFHVARSFEGVQVGARALELLQLIERRRTGEAVALAHPLRRARERSRGALQELGYGVGAARDEVVLDDVGRRIAALALSVGPLDGEMHFGHVGLRRGLGEVLGLEGTRVELRVPIGGAFPRERARDVWPEPA